MSAGSDVIIPSASAAQGASRKDPSILWLVAGLILLGASLAGVLTSAGTVDPSRPFLGWLVAGSFWLSILIGALFLTMIWWAFDAGWPLIVRRQFEHLFAAFPYLALIFLPLLLLTIVGNPELIAWIWMKPEAPVPGGHGTVASDVLFQHKDIYLDLMWFCVRFVAYFGVWLALALLLRRWSYKTDETGDLRFVRMSRKLAGAGLFLCAFASTFAAVDWFKSLNYHWFSTMYGVWFFSASMRAGLSAAVLLLFYMAGRDDGLKGIVRSTHFYYIGCLMLAFTIFWAYISFSQFFLIYNANIPEETFWYVMRELAADGGKNSWWFVSRGLIFLHFFFPFLWLLWYKNKFGWRIQFMAVWILGFHLLDLYWNIVPQKMPADNVLGYTTREFSIHWVDFTTLLGIGAVMIWAFLRSAARHRPIPIRDPHIYESLNCHE